MEKSCNVKNKNGKILYKNILIYFLSKKIWVTNKKIKSWYLIGGELEGMEIVILLKYNYDLNSIKHYRTRHKK